MSERFAKKDRKRVLLALGYNDFHLNQGVWKYCQEAGWILETSMANYGVIPEFWDGDGIITILYPDRKGLIDYIARSDAHVVNMTNDVALGSKVLLNNVRCGELAAEHLLDRGFRKLAFLKLSDGEDICGRLEGFKKCALDAGAAFSLIDGARVDKHTDLYSWLREEVRRLPSPVGILAQSDNRANLLMNVCDSLNLLVPEEVAIVGVDNNEMVCQSAMVPITSVDSNRERLAYEAGALLDRLMHGEAPPSQPIFVEPKEVVVRQSSNILAIEHPEVASALKFIWEHFGEAIQVEDVLAASSMSRCGLYRAFEKYVGRSIGAEISRKRMEKSKVLLAHTTHKHYEIADLCGFSDGEHFSRSFTRSVGMTPSAYRRQNS